MKKILSILIVFLMLLPIAATYTNAKEVIGNHYDKKKLEFIKNIMNEKKETDAVEILGPGPVGDHKTVEVTIFLPDYANVQNRYFYEDEFYSGYIPIYKQKKVRYSDGTTDWMVTYRGDVYFKK